MTFEQRVKAVAAERSAGEAGSRSARPRFLATVMLHAGVCMKRQYLRCSDGVRADRARLLRQPGRRRRRHAVHRHARAGAGVPRAPPASVHRHRRTAQPPAQARRRSGARSSG